MIQPIEDPRPNQWIMHCNYDVCNCDECLDEANKFEYDEGLPKSKKGSRSKMKKMFENGDPNVRLIGEQSGNLILMSCMAPHQKIPYPLTSHHKTLLLNNQRMDVML
ncbi:hypothetical protein R6Q59_035861 [Mikania micrantha]